MTYLTLGSIKFEPLPVTGLGEEYAWEYPEHAVIEGKPILQYIGDGLTVTTLNIRLAVSFCNPQSSFDEIKAAADEHKPLMLSAGNGTLYGLRVITRLSKTLVKTADNGRPILIEAQLTLKEWVDVNPLGSKQAAQQATAAGLSGKGPVANPAPATPPQASDAAGQARIITRMP